MRVSLRLFKTKNVRFMSSAAFPVPSTNPSDKQAFNLNLGFNKEHPSKKAAMDLFQKGHFFLASELFTTILAQNSTDPEVLAAQALCICQLPARFAEAEKLVNVACSYGNDAAPFAIAKGHVLREIGKVPESVKLLTNLLKWEDRNWYCHFELGCSLNKNWGRYSAGMLHLDKSLELNPDFLDASYHRGEAYYWLDTCNENPFEWLNRLNSGHSVRRDFYLGLNSYHQKDFRSAISHFEKAQVGWKSYDNHDLDSWRGEAFLALNELDKALVEFDKALGKNPRDALSVHSKGEVLRKQGNDAEGKELQNKALEIDRLYFKQDYFRVKEPIQKGV